MATRNKRKLAALNEENCEEHPRSNLVLNSNVPRSKEDYITQVSGEIEGRVIKKLSQEFSRMENPILSALARLDDFLMNPLLQGHSGTAPEASRKVLSMNQGTNEDDSQSDAHPEADLLTSGREDRHDMATGVQIESVDSCDSTHSLSWLLIQTLVPGVVMISIAVKTAFWINQFKNMTLFQGDPIREVSFQYQNIQCALTGYCYTVNQTMRSKLSITYAAIDYNILPFTTYFFANKNILIKVLYLANKTSASLFLHVCQSHVCFNIWIAFLKEINQFREQFLPKQTTTM